MSSCFLDDRLQPNTGIFKSDGSDVYAYILNKWWSGVVTTKAGIKLHTDICLTVKGEEKPRNKPHPEHLSQPGIELGPAV